MTLNVETGNAGNASDSYASAADADTYFSDRGLTNWATLSLNEKEQALRRATDYMQQTYRDRWAGFRTTTTQALDWPRWNVPLKDLPGSYGAGPVYFDSHSIPSEVKTACIMLAFKAAAGDLAPDLGSQKASVKIGPIETTYFQGTRQATKIQSVDHILQPYLNGSGLNIKVVRA